MKKTKTLTLQQRKELLSQIAAGELKIPTEKTQWNATEKKHISTSVLEVPDHATRLRAIAELNKLEGDYAPEKKDINLQTEINLQNLSDEDLLTLSLIQQKALNK